MFTSKKNSVYVIAEVGQNHQGDFQIALDYVDKLASIGVDAVKFQMRNNNSLFSNEKLSALYSSENAFGSTYGAHRDALELSFDEMFRLREAAANKGVDFICTPFDEESLLKLIKLDVDAVKVASFDFGNMPFINSIIKSEKKYIISTGGSDYKIVDQFVSAMIEQGGKFALLHCVSQYPCNPEDVNIGRIEYLKNKFPSLQVGLSDHYSGILTGPLGYVKGAEVFEKHVTFNRSWKGTDHSFSLTIDGMRKFIRDINRTDAMLGDRQPLSIGKEYVFKKLGKSLIACREIRAGQKFTVDNVSSKILGSGIPVRQSLSLIGSVAKSSYVIGQAIEEFELEGNF